ncbi:haloacid dehalogenase [Halobacteriales archaeon QS_1_68_20]|nr:MAG: haloacid dehalogenase [Halobacteriales archaeon QS_1_68_20]
MTAVDAVLFDLDDTLVEYRRSTVEVLDAAFERAGVDPFFAVEAYHERFDEFAKTADTIEELRTACFAAIADERGRDPADGEAVAAAYAEERDQANVDPLPGARAAVDALAADHRLGLVSNGTPGMQRTKLTAAGLEDAFEVTVFGGAEVPPKPDPAPFERALTELGASPERAVHVGNSASTDVAGAHAAGLRSVWLRRGAEGDAAAPTPEPHHVVASPGALTDPPWR